MKKTIAFIYCILLLVLIISSNTIYGKNQLFHNQVISPSTNTKLQADDSFFSKELSLPQAINFNTNITVEVASLFSFKKHIPFYLFSILVYKAIIHQKIVRAIYAEHITPPIDLTIALLVLLI